MLGSFDVTIGVFMKRKNHIDAAPFHLNYYTSYCGRYKELSIYGYEGEDFVDINSYTDIKPVYLCKRCLNHPKFILDLLASKL